MGGNLRVAGRLVGALVVLMTCVAKEEEESSDAYLRNVVNELQLLNGPAPSEGSLLQPLPTASDYLSNYHYYEAVEAGKGRYGIGFGKQPHRHSETNGAQLLPFPLPLSERELPIASRLNYLPPPASISKAYEPKGQQQVARLPAAAPAAPSSTLLGFTPVELASMFKQALERGTPLKYNTLINTISDRTPKLTSVSDFQLADTSKFPPRESQYAYYFYPLQTFRHELQNQYGYKTLPDFIHDPAVSETKTKETSIMHPILVGIGSFLGMALFFVLSLFIYPRFLHYTSFPFSATSRTTFQSDLEHLAIFVIEAIDYYKRSVELQS